MSANNRQETPVANELIQKILSLKQDRTFGTRLLEFWSTVFLEAGPQASDFGSRFASQFSYAKVTNEEVSFTPAILKRKSKPFLVLTQGAVRGVIHISRVGRDGADLYVSARFLFQAGFNRWKQVAFHFALAQVALIQALFFFWPAWIVIGATQSELEYRTDNVLLGTTTTGEYVDKPNWGNALLAYILTFFILYGLWWVVSLVVSYWRYNDPFALTREDFDELDRDDLASLAYEVYIGVQTIADEMTLAQMQFEEKPRREFGTTASSNIKRERRI